MGLETAAAIGLGISALGSGYQIFQGARSKSDANAAAAKAAQQYASVNEANKFNSLKVPTLGLELAQQNIQSRQAQELQGLRDIGAAGVLGGLTALNTQSQAQDLQLAAQAQEAQYARDMAQAQNAQQLEANRVGRETGMAQSRLQGAQIAAAEGASNIAAGIGGLAQGASNAATLYAYKQGYGKKTTETEKPTNTNPTQTPVVNTSPVTQSVTTPPVTQSVMTSPNQAQISTIPEITVPAGATGNINDVNPVESFDESLKRIEGINKKWKERNLDLSKDPEYVKLLLKYGLEFDPKTGEFERNKNYKE